MIEAWLHYSGDVRISDADLARLFPDGVPDQLDADTLRAALFAAHRNDVGGYLPSSYEVSMSVTVPNPHYVGSM